MQINNLAAASIPVYNAQVPREGPRALSLPLLDFSVASSFTFDGQNLMDNSRISMVQTMYLDARNAQSPITVLVGGVQTIVVKPQTQGYYPVICPNPCNIVFSCADNLSKVNVQLLNVPVAPGQWVTA